MNTARMAILGVASLAGVCCVGVLMHGLAGARPAPPAPVVVAAAPPIPTVRVLVASRDLPVGERIQGGDMAWATWPADAARANTAYVTDGSPAAAAPTGQLNTAASKVAGLAKDAVSDPADGPGSSFVGAIVRERISRNEPLIASKVVRAGQSGVLAVTLDPGLRAVALPLTPETAAGGFILPGDHVDVILTRAADAQGAAAVPGHGQTASTVMRNVRVLAIDQNMGSSAAHGSGANPAAAAVGATATVEVTPAQAETLVLAKASGSLTLSLRSYADAAGGAQTGSLGDAGGSSGVVRVFRAAVATSTAVNR